ncbi:biotin transporter BioY [Methanolobus psychrotolerans]|uniref:biotin transporter BioY n=1 Tax=Methanolobus psychrotolerans TaxID=1874706 RepID=UPI000B91B9F7|nr:biotin transporter BioY [Methanolobus psychrotolerans]
MADKVYIHNSNIRKMVYASLFAAMMAVGAYIKIPVPVSPVPVTLQTLFILLAGAMLGARWGTISVIVYLLLGIAGLPVFSGGSSGLGMLFGPTGGYLAGFVFGAFIIGLLCDRYGREKVHFNALFMLAGLSVIYLFGVLQLMNVASLSLQEAVAIGLIPFIPGAFLKLLTSAVIASRYSI